MSIKNLFDKRPVSYDSANSSSVDVESHDYVLAKNKKQREFVPRLDFSTASNFAVYGSAEQYYKSAIERIYNFYPYDGSKKEKIEFSLASSYIDDWLYTNKYPKTTGLISFSFGGWGAVESQTNGYGLPTTKEYIYSRGGLHTASQGMAGTPLYKTFNDSVKYDASLNRTTNYRMNMSDGVTIEFWLKKDQFDITKTKKEVILDLWNGELSSSSDYGRMTIALTSSAQADGSQVFLATLQSGTVGFFEQSIGTSTVTTASLSSWHHYSLSFSSASSGVSSRIYFDGKLNESKTLGTAGINEIGGLINGYIGALQTSPSSSEGALTQTQLKYAGKLNASLDEFRYWKTLRSSKQIKNNWNRALGSGTNTDEANVNLGVYYKFNEGITGTSSVDSTVLDYSGRIANGTWTGYSAGARDTSSAIDIYSLTPTEEKDPIIYSFHPEVSSLLQEMTISGSLHDEDNGNMLINKFPQWMVEDDQENNSHLIYLTQIISSYLDKLNSQISQLKKNKFLEYTEGNIKPLTFADRLIEEKGIVTSDIMVNSEILEFFENRDDDGTIYENELFDIKNMIYQNIYNNLNHIYKSKGTEDSFRNLIRCFGIDDEILKINRYTDGGTHYFTDKVKHTSVYKKFINHNNNGFFESTIFQTSSATNDATYISGSSASKKEKNNALTFEINLIAPKKTPSNEDEYLNYPYVSSSIAGFHQAKADERDYDWNSSNLANLQMYIIRDSIDSPGGHFLLKNYNGTIALSSSYFREIYNDHNWTVAARIKPLGFPYAGIEGSPDQPTYNIEFYGAHHRGDVLVDSFSASSSLSYALGSSYLSERKRVYAGAHWTNFDDSVLTRSDLSIGTCRFYLDYLDDDVLNQHNKDIKNYGSNKTFEGSSLVNVDAENRKIPSTELLILNWDFETVTGSDSSGNFIVEDISSGSAETKYGYLDSTLNTENRGKGFNFGNSKTKFVKNNFMYAAKKELPEISYTADDITIKGDAEQNFIEDTDVSDNFYAFEKGMYQVISEEMMNYLSSTEEMNNLIGKVVDKYRFNYKSLDYMRRIFFENVEGDPDLDRFTEYFKWIDKSIYVFLEQLIPISARYSSKISDVIESHIFERNKVRSLIPNKFVEVTPVDSISSIRELKYNWRFGHAPIGLSKATATIVVTDAGGIGHGETFDLTDFANVTTKYLINGGVDPEDGGGTGGTVATVGTRGVGGGVSGKIAAANAIAIAINNTTGVIYSAVSNGVDTVTVTQRDDGTEGNKINDDSVNGVTVGNFIGGDGRRNTNCLWQRERVERRDIGNRETLRKSIVNDNNQVANNLADESGNTYKGSTYALRRLSRPYHESVSIQKMIHGGVNYERQKNRRISKNVLEPHSRLSSTGTPLNVILVGAGTGQGIEVTQECDDVLLPNLKKKFEVKTTIGKFAAGSPGGAFSAVNDNTTYSFGLKGSLVLPFNIYTGSLNSGYNKRFHQGWRANSYITNIHSDTVFDGNDIPMQGPFTERWVGGHQARHQDVNRYDTSLIDGETSTPPPNNLHNKYTRAESHRILLIDSGGGSDGAIGLADAQYGLTDKTGHQNDGKYPDVHKRKAVLFREETAKRPLNIKNIQTTTASYSHGNYREQYEILCVASGKQHNNPLFRSIADVHQYLPTAIESILPQTTNYNTLIGVSDHSAGNVFGVGESNILNNTVDILSTKLGTNSVITFTVKPPAQIAHGSTLQITGAAVTHLTEINNPETAISHPNADLILRTGSLGLGFRAPASPTFSNSNRANDNSYSGFNNSVSVSFWLYGGSIQTSNKTKILWQAGANDRHRIEFEQTKVKVMYVNTLGTNDTAEFSSNITADAGKWQHYVVHFDVANLGAGVPKLWKNGTELSSTGYSVIGGTSPSIDRLHLRLDDLMGYQDVVVWGKLLTQEDIDILYASGSWNNPRTHPSSSQIIDWYKYGYEDYWSGYSNGDPLTDHGAAPYTVSSSFGTGNNDLSIDSSYDQDFFFVTGNNPFGTIKSDSAFWNELSSSLAGAFGQFSTPYSGLGPVSFTMTSATTGSIAVGASHVGGLSGGFGATTATIGTDPSTKIETGYINVTSKATGSTQKSVITSRFSAPGAIETMTYGFLDAHNQELSAYNALPYRNLHIRGSGSGEVGTIRVNDHLGNREGLITHLSRHSGKFGADSVHGSVTSAGYVTKPSFHKTQRNTARKVVVGSTLTAPTFNLDHDNYFVMSTIPRSDFQYNWITSSLGSNYSINSGKQRMFGYAPKDGIISSSYEVNSDSGFVPAITFPTASEIYGV
jgi:hypothetical protein